jgi:hypothetical protein
LDMSNTVGKNQEVIDELITGSGTSTFNQNNSCVDLQVTNALGRVIRQSRRYCIYQPGKSLLIQFTGVLNANNNPSYVTTRMGYYDDNNGYFFQLTNNTLSIVERSFVSGIVTENVVNQVNWNINTLTTNSPPTSYILDVTKAQIFILDFQWLGVGRVRCGVVHNGIITYVHEFLHDNITTQTYTTTMNLPIRYEIANTTDGIITPATAVLRQICATAISEGGYNPVGQVYSAARAASASVNSTETFLLGIRLKIPNNSPSLNRNRTNVIPGLFEILTGSNNANLQFFIRLYRAPAASPVLGGLWVDADPKSAVQYNVSGSLDLTSLGASTLINQGYVSGKTSKNVSEDVTFAFSENNQLTCNIAGTLTDYFIISAKTLDNNINTFTTLDWREIY